MGQLQTFEKRLQRAVLAVRDSMIKEAIVLHHDEADGLTSAALSKIALEHLGLETKLICLDKLYPEILRGLSQSIVALSCTLI